MDPLALGPKEFFTWALTISAFASVFLGSLTILLCCAAFWKQLHKFAAVLTFMLFGIILVTVPKWKEITFEMYGVSGKIQSAEIRIKSLENENTKLAANLATVSNDWEESLANVASLNEQVNTMKDQQSQLVNAFTEVKKVADRNPGNALSTVLKDIFKDYSNTITPQ